MKKIFFIHLPKTAGSSFNKFLKKHFNGKDHCEVWLNQGSKSIFDASRLERLKSLEYISGHLEFEVFAANNFNREEYFWLTLMREPTNQLLSHLNFVMSIWDTDPNFLKQHPEIKEVAFQLRNSNLYDPNILIPLLQQPKLEGLFRNSQTKYFSHHPDETGSRFIIDRMLQLDMVGITESYAETLSLFASLVGLDYSKDETDTENKTPQYVVKNDILTNRLVHEFLLEYNSIDIEVYNHYLTRFRESISSNQTNNDETPVFRKTNSGRSIDRTRSILFDIELKQTRGLEIGSQSRPILSKKEVEVFYADYFLPHVLKQQPDVEVVDPEENLEVVDSEENLEVVKEGKTEEAVKIDYTLNLELSLQDAIGKDEYFDYIVVSQVLERVPNPIKWLEELWQLLTDSGKLSLVIADKRFCSDYLRQLTTSGDWIESYLHNNTKPSAKAIFDAISNAVSYKGKSTWSEFIDQSQVRKVYTLEQAFELAQSISDKGLYNVNSWCFTPDSFLRVIHDLIGLRLLNFSISYFNVTLAGEFHIILKKEKKDTEVGTLLTTMPYELSHREVALPKAFNGKRYLRLNPDVDAAGVDPVQHFLRFGRKECRKYI